MRDEVTKAITGSENLQGAAILVTIEMNSMNLRIPILRGVVLNYFWIVADDSVTSLVDTTTDASIPT